MELANSFLPTLEHVGVLVYWLVLLISLVEALPLIGAIVPGSILTMLAGFLSAQGYLDFGDLIFFVTMGAILGDSVSYYLGTKWARLFHTGNKVLKISHLERGEQFFRKHGSKSILLGRFISPLRPIVPFIAGLTKMNKWQFLLWNIVSAFLWAAVYLSLGYFFGGAIKMVETWSTRASLFLLVLFGALFILWLFVRRGRALFAFGKSVTLSIKNAIVTNPDVQQLTQKHPILFRFIRRRFDRERFSGLTLTFLVIAFVYVLSLFFGIVGDVVTSDVIVAADTRVANLLLAFRDAELMKFFSWITLLGKWQIVVSSALVFSLILWLWHKRIYILLLWLTLIGSELFVMLGKLALHRARPEVALYVENSFSFPSGHATVAVAFYGFVSYVLFRQIKDWKYKANILFVCLLVISTIGLSRLYLGEHFLSDVWAGYLLGTLWLLIGITLSEAFRYYWASASFTPTAKVKVISLFLIFAEAVFYVGFALRYNPSFSAQKTPNIIITDDVISSFYDGQLSPYTEALVADKQEPLSFIIIARNDRALFDAIKKAGWLLADSVTIVSVARFAQSAVLNNSYPTAPMTPSFWNAKVHDFGFEKPTNTQSVRERHHARFWRTEHATDSGERVYVGTASQDSGIKWLIAGKISPDLDTERELMFMDLQKAGVIASFKKEQFVKPTLGKNFSGDQFFTDGEIYVVFLK